MAENIRKSLLLLFAIIPVFACSKKPTLRAEDQLAQTLLSQTQKPNEASLEEVQSMLTVGTEWLTIPYVSGETGIMSSPIPTQSWTITENRSFAEKTALSPETDCGSFRSETEKLPEDAPIRELFKVFGKYTKMKSAQRTLSDLVYLPPRGLDPSICSESLNSRQHSIFVLAKSKDLVVFEVRYLNGNQRVLFVQNKKDFVKSEWSKRRVGEIDPTSKRTRVHIATAPLGFNHFNLSQLPGIEIPETGFLLASPYRPRTIAFDLNFPSEHKAIVLSAAKEWNKVFGFKVFNTDVTLEGYEPGLCLAINLICITWNGPKEIPWSGLSAFGAPSFDPLSGQLKGATILVTNLPTPLNQITSELEKLYNDNKNSLLGLLKLVSKLQDFKPFRAINGKEILKMIFTHELGHTLGLKHNFYGSNGFGPESPINSIMDYQPVFSINEQTSSPQNFDLAAVNFVYKGTPIPSNYQTCSDDESGGDIYFKKIIGNEEVNPNCRKNDLGKPLDWILNLTKKSPLNLEGIDSYSNDTFSNTLLEFIQSNKIIESEKNSNRSRICSVAKSNNWLLNDIWNKICLDSH
jgi:hypothetical protein